MLFYTTGFEITGNAFQTQFYYTPSASGTYTLIVARSSDFGGGGSTQTYSLYVGAPTPVTVPLNPAGQTANGFTNQDYTGPGAASNLQAPPGGWFGNYHQQWYSATLSAGTIVTVSVTGNDPLYEIVSLQDPNANQIAFNQQPYGSTSLPASTTTVTTLTGTYTIIAATTTSSAISYSLRVLLLAPPTGAQVTGGTLTWTAPVGATASMLSIARRPRAAKARLPTQVPLGRPPPTPTPALLAAPRTSTQWQPT